MRGAWTVALLLFPLTAGCLDAGTVFGSDPDAASCTQTVVPYMFWLDAGLSLSPTAPSSSGKTDGNAFSNAFLVDEADEWLSDPFMDGIRILGDVTLDLWVERQGTPAVFVDQATPDPSQGWQFFTQFGTDRGFAPDYHNVHGDTVAEPGTVTQYAQEFTMPEGGLVVERGDRLRLLLTSLVLDSTDDGSHAILWGGDTPSALSFEAVCYVDRDWAFEDGDATSISLAGNQGLLTGAVPEEEGFNIQSVPFTLRAATERLTITLEQDPNTVAVPKNDMDVVVLDASGAQVWSVGSPYSDEAGRLWKQNLDAFMPPGDYTAQVHSYSGKQYTGTLTITQESSFR